MDQLLALKVFIRIAESGAFSKAADMLNMPRPTATKAIQDLERHVGVKLLQRTTRQVSVTAEGAAYYERAVRLLAELAEMDETVSHARTRLRGRIRVDIGSLMANRIVIPALPDLRARYPELYIDLGVTDRPIDLIGEGVDCVVRGGDLADIALVARRIADLNWVTVASPDYLSAHGEPNHPDEIQVQKRNVDGHVNTPGHTLAGYFSSLSGKATPLEFKREDEWVVVKGETAVAVNESTAHVSALLAGVGIGQTFRFAVAPYLESGQLREVLPDWTRPRLPLHLVYPSDRRLSAKLNAFGDWLAEVFAPFDDRPRTN